MWPRVIMTLCIAAYGSVCSGIEAATVAWHPLGWRAPSSPRSRRSPAPSCNTAGRRPPAWRLHHDPAGEYEPIDLLVGGTPCQSFSVAGLRGGLDDDRGNLALEYLRLADRLRPRWLVWENVPGVLSSAEDGTLEPYSGAWSNSGMGSPTECLTLSSSEWPSDAAVCSLSDTLETGDVPQRFFLSATACKGILRRAEKRGKELPPA
jgi:hypothetical protein